MTSRPCALSSRARLVTAMVGDGLMRPSADERIGKGGAPGVEAGAVLGRRGAGGKRRGQRPELAGEPGDAPVEPGPAAQEPGERPRPRPPRPPGRPPEAGRPARP